MISTVYLSTRNRYDRYTVQNQFAGSRRSVRLGDTCAHVAIRDLRRIAAANCSFCDRYRCLLYALCAMPFSSACGFLLSLSDRTPVRNETQGEVRFESTRTQARSIRSNATHSKRPSGAPERLLCGPESEYRLCFFYRDAHGKKGHHNQNYSISCQYSRNYDIGKLSSKNSTEIEQ